MKILLISVIFLAFQAQASNDLEIAKRALRDGLWSIAEKRAMSVVNGADSSEKNEARLVVLEALSRAHRPSEMLAYLDSWGYDGQDEGLRYWRAWALVTSRKYEEARQVLSGAFTNSAYSVLAPQLSARLETRAGNRAEAESYYRATALSCGTNSPLRTGNAIDWARALVSFSDDNAAIGVLKSEKALDAVGALGDSARILAADISLRLGDKAAAEKYCGQIIAEGTNATESAFVQASCLLASKMISSGDVAQATQCASNAVARAVSPRYRRLAGYALGFCELEIPAKRAQGRARIRDLVREFPDAVESKDAQLKLADTLLLKGDSAKAIEEYRLYLEIYPDSSADVHVLEGRGWAFLQMGRRTEAIGMFARAAQVATNELERSRCVFKQADALAAENRFLEAAQVYERVKDPSFREQARFNEADSYLRAGEISKAHEIFSDIISEGGSFAVKAALRVAANYSTAGRTDNALDIYQKIMDGETSGKNLDVDVKADVLLGRGKAYYRAYRFRDASNDFEEVAKLKPSQTDKMRFFMALCMFGEGRDDESKKAAEEVLRITKNEALRIDVVLWLAKYAFNHGDYEAAMKGFIDSAKSIKDPLKVSQTFVLAARSAAALSDYTKVIELVTIAVNNLPKSMKEPGSSNPTFPEALILQGEALMELARFDEAVLVFERASLALPGTDFSRKASVMKADSFYAMGADNESRYKSALEAYRAALRDEKIPPSVRVSVSYKIGRVLEKLRMFEEAMDQYYANVVNVFEDGRRDGVWFDAAARSDYTRAAFALADHYEARGENLQALRVLQLVAASGISAADEARKRIARIKKKGSL